MLKSKAHVLVGIVASLLVGPAVAATVADQASAIVVGEISSGRQLGNSAVFTFSVARVLKGDLKPGASIPVSGTVKRADLRDLTGRYGLWFLKRIGESWELLPVDAGRVGVFDTAFYPLSKRSIPADLGDQAQPPTVEDRIELEILGALPSHSSNPLEYQLLANAVVQSRGGPATERAFQSLRSSTDPELRFLALARALSKDRDASALAELANDIEQTAGLKATFFVVPGVLGWLDPNSLAIGHLGKIAASSDLYLQRAAATALMNIHTTDALPFLAKLLDSSDGATRELAMRGLSRFVEGMPIPTHENILSGRATLAQEPTPYRTAETARYSLATRSLAQAPETEAAFLSFWKSWWEAVQGSVVVAGR